MKRTLAAFVAAFLLAHLAAAGAQARGRGHRGPDLSGKSREELLVLMAADTDEKVRAAAAGALLAAHEAESFKPLLAALESAQTPERVRSTLAYGIHQFGDKSAVPALMKSLDTPSLRFESMHSLGELEAKEAVEPIIDIVIAHIMHGEDGKEDFLDHNAEMTEGTEALGKIGEVKGLRGVLPMLGQQEHPYRRQVAVRAIASISENPQTPEIIRTDLATVVFTHLLDPKEESDSSVRLEAVFGLSHLKALSAEAALRTACESDVDSRVRYAADDALKQMRAPGGPCDPLKPIRPILEPSPLDQQ